MPTQVFAASGIFLSDILPHARPTAAGDVCFQACTTVATSVQPGDLYVALDGSAGDGHLDVALAIDRGAQAVVAERYLPVSAPQFLVEDTREALALIGQALAGHPSQKMSVLGILDGTHSVGTSILLSAVLERAGLLTAIANETGACDGVRTASDNTPLTCPLSLAKWLAESQANQSHHAIIGLTPTSVGHRATDAVELSHLVLTSLKPDRGAGFANPRTAAERLLSQVRAEGLLFYCQDDLLCRSVAEESEIPSLSFGFTSDACVRGDIVERCAGQQTLLMEGLGDYAAVQTRLFGQRFATFCLAAAAVGLAHGLELTTIAGALEQVESLPYWLEPVCLGQSFGIYLDQAWDPWSVRQCIKSLKGTVSGRIICVTSIDPRLTQDECAILGRVVESGSHIQILTADAEPEVHQRSRRVHGVLDGFLDPARPMIVPNRTQAVEYALSVATADDVILLLGCGGEFQHRAARHKDRQVIANWIQRQESTLAFPSTVKKTA